MNDIKYQLIGVDTLMYCGRRSLGLVSRPHNKYGSEAKGKHTTQLNFTYLNLKEGLLYSLAQLP